MIYPDSRALNLGELRRNEEITILSSRVIRDPSQVSPCYQHSSPEASMHLFGLLTS